VVAQFMGTLRRELEPHTSVMEIVLRPDEDLIELRDPHDARRILDLKYTGYALERRGMPQSPPGTWMGEHYDDDWFVELQAVDDAVLATLPRLQSAALDRLKMPGGRVEAVGIGRHADILEGNQRLVVEVAVKGDDGVNGRVYFDLHGKVLRKD
jgi:hypothetical protein